MDIDRVEVVAARGVIHTEIGSTILFFRLYFGGGEQHNRLTGLYEHTSEGSFSIPTPRRFPRALLTHPILSAVSSAALNTSEAPQKLSPGKGIPPAGSVS